ncbi:MAG TPA: decaprenyl-phosphate phosphoribosyltransferase [Proteobacteria bacterium]|nr:decaprenyl-phosphate phosphoribosyltransferase [bacterium BMS3Abin14]HDL52492.1 decaprenyl-phosphate phosphoribosyltransferase [Pseudomonadota bacterium]
MSLNPFWRLMRPHQWLKNGFVLAALVFSRHLLELSYVSRALVAVAAFCLASSAVYVFNDIVDREQDRTHSDKKNRPIASGEVSVGSALPFGIMLLAGALALTVSLGAAFSMSVLAYLGLQLAYNLFLKNVVLLDIFTIALGFVIRAVAGALAIKVVISPWLILCTLLIALFLGFAKRRHEIVLMGDNAVLHRGILREYSIPFLDQLISIVTASTIVSYAIYTLSPEVAANFGGRYMILTLPFVIYGIFRYLYLVQIRESGGSPTRSLMLDGPLLLSVLLWGMAAVAIIYLAG